MSRCAGECSKTELSTCFSQSQGLLGVMRDGIFNIGNEEESAAIVLTHSFELGVAMQLK